MKNTGFAFLAVILIVSSFLYGQPFTKRYASLGEMFVPQFSSAPFPHPLRADGRMYNNTKYPAEKHYSDSSVAIFIPKHFKPGKTNDVVLYFHGWYNNIDSACAQFKLIEQFTEAKKNAIFVFPEGPKDAPDSFGGRVEETNGLKNLLSDVMNYVFEKKKITSKKIGNIILAGHSGAFRVISYALLRGGLTKNISDVILFDAHYGQTEKFAYWIDHYKGRYVNIYTDSGGTKNETENLMADLDGWGIPYYRTEETDISQTDLKKNRLIFIHTELSHNDVIATKKQLRDYLSSSRLENIKIQSHKLQ
jgi:hypothetical protein